LLYLAEKLRFHTKELHNEIFSSIDFKAGWNTTVTRPKVVFITPKSIKITIAPIAPDTVTINVAAHEHQIDGTA